MKDAQGNPRIPTITTTNNRIEEIVETIIITTTTIEVISTTKIDNLVTEEGISITITTITSRIHIIGIAIIITIDILDRDHHRIAATV